MGWWDGPKMLIVHAWAGHLSAMEAANEKARWRRGGGGDPKHSNRTGPRSTIRRSTGIGTVSQLVCFVLSAATV